MLIPIGAMEQHGPHMSMNHDVLLPTAIGVGVARRIGALVAPAIAYGYRAAAAIICVARMDARIRLSFFRCG